MSVIKVPPNVRQYAKDALAFGKRAAAERADVASKRGEPFTMEAFMCGCFEMALEQLATGYAAEFPKKVRT